MCNGLPQAFFSSPIPIPHAHDFSSSLSSLTRDSEDMEGQFVAGREGRRKRGRVGEKERLERQVVAKRRGEREREEIEREGSQFVSVPKHSNHMLVWVTNYALVHSTLYTYMYVHIISQLIYHQLTNDLENWLHFNNVSQKKNLTVNAIRYNTLQYMYTYI